MVVVVVVVFVVVIIVVTTASTQGHHKDLHLMPLQSKEGKSIPIHQERVGSGLGKTGLPQGL